MVPLPSILAMVVVAVACVLVPVGAFAWIATRRNAGGGRRWPRVWRAFWAGALAFVVPLLINAGQWPTIAAALPQAEAATLVEVILLAIAVALWFGIAKARVWFPQPDAALAPPGAPAQK